MIVSVNKTQLIFFQVRGFLCLLILASLFGCSSPKKYLDIAGPAMGTSYTIRLVPQRGLIPEMNQIKTQVDSILNSINQQMSTYVANSEISLFNKIPTNSAIVISHEFKQVINRSLHWSNLSKGAFDISSLPLSSTWKKGKADREYDEVWQPPTDLEITLAKDRVGYDKIKLAQNSLIKSQKGQELDVNAIAKGWGVDRLFNFIKSIGYQNFMIEIGGEVRVLGKNNRGKAWRIGIDSPKPSIQPGEKIIAVVPIINKAMATSGNYRNFYEFDSSKFSHIIDPRSGYAIESNISSVTVVAATCMDADAIATALNVMSLESGKELVESLDEVEAYWVINKNEQFQTVQSSGMKVDSGF